MNGDSYDITAPEARPESQKVVRAAFAYGKTVLATLLVAFLLKTFVVEAFRIPSGSMENTLQVGDFLLVNKLAYGLRTPRVLPLTGIRIPSLTIPLPGSVKRGDIIVFELPGSFALTDREEQMNYIKRCIGLPGDTVMIRQSRVFVNGRELTVPPAAKLGDHQSLSSWQRGVRVVPGGRGYTENNYGPVVVPKKGDVVLFEIAEFEEWVPLIEREGRRVERGPDGTVFIDGAPAGSYTLGDDYYFVLGDNRHNSLDSRFWGFVPDRFLIGEALLVYWSWNPDIGILNLADKVRSIRWDRVGMFIR